MLFILIPFLGFSQDQIGKDIDVDAEQDQSAYSVNLSSDGVLVALGAPGNDRNSFWSGHATVYSIASELAILEDITGNINGVSGAIEVLNYTTVWANGTFVDKNNPTVV